MVAPIITVERNVSVARIILALNKANTITKCTKKCLCNNSRGMQRSYIAEIPPRASLQKLHSRYLKVCVLRFKAAIIAKYKRAKIPIIIMSISLSPNLNKLNANHSLQQVKQLPQKAITVLFTVPATVIGASETIAALHKSCHLS